MYYPINLDVREKVCLVVGGGNAAYRKVKGLLRAGASVGIVSPRRHPGLRNLAKSRKVRFIGELFKASHLAGKFLVIAATDDKALNARIGSLCRKRKLLVNVVDQPKECNFTVPSIVRRGRLTIAIATDGASPALSKAIRKDLEKRYGREYGTYLDLMADLRPELLRKLPSVSRRKRRLEKVVRAVLFGENGS